MLMISRRCCPRSPEGLGGDETSLVGSGSGADHIKRSSSQAQACRVSDSSVLPSSLQVLEDPKGLLGKRNDVEEKKLKKV